MADIYDSEQEQIEALKRWWKENGKTVVAGLVLGLGGVFGWTSWQEYRRAEAESASALFQAQSEATARQAYPEADQLGARLLDEHPGSGYAGMAALLLAKSAFEQDRVADARRHLQWVLDNGARRELVLTARLRLATLALDAGDPDGALALLATADTGSFQAAYQELRGDALVAQSKRDDARAAYEDALATLPQGTPAASRVSLKLDDLGHVNVGTD